MSDDFQVGDVVVCVDAGARSGCVSYPRVLIQGAFYRLSWVGVFTNNEPAVELQGDPTTNDDSAWEANRFRKLPPADAEFTRDMRALKPHREEVPA